LLLDGAVDGSLIAFACWTLFYEVALLFQFSVLWAAWPWLLGALLIVVASSMRAAVRGRPRVGADAPSHRLRPVLLVAAALIIAIVVAARSSLGLVPMAVVGIVVLACQLWPWWQRRAMRREPLWRQEHDAEAEREAPAGAQMLAVAVSLGLAVLSVFLLRPDADDVFYVNRATWIAQRGIPVISDTMFTPGKLVVPYNGGLPTPSIEALQGALAHAVGVQAATMAYLVFVPVLAFLAGWATWRLVRAWARRWHAAAFLIAVAFVLASGASVIGNYYVGRLWQGKVVAFVVLLPLIWLFLGRLADRGRRYEIVMLLVAGICFVGLTTTSAMLGPVVAAAGMLAALVLRSRALLLGSLALLAAPLVNGVVQMFGPGTVGGTDISAPPTTQVFTMAFGTVGVLAIIGVLGTVLAPRLVVGPASVVAASASLAVLVIYVPGVLPLVNAATNAGAVVWRLGIEAPIAALVGLLATTTLPDRLTIAMRSWPIHRGLAGAITVVLVVVLVVSGRWIWTAEGGGRVTSTPEWKLEPAALTDVRDALRVGDQAGRWLMPPVQMETLAITRIGPFAVVPREDYLPYLDVSRQRMQDHVVLFNFVAGRSLPAPSAIRGALRRLDVTLACVSASDRPAKAVLRHAAGGLRQVGDMECHLGRPAAAVS
jgi:hypothetical protein